MYVFFWGGGVAFVISGEFGIKERVLTHLIPKHPDGCSGGHLVGSEPDGGESGRDPEDEDLGDGAYRLSGHQHREAVPAQRRAFYPRARRIERGCQDTHDA